MRCGQLLLWVYCVVLLHGTAGALTPARTTDKPSPIFGSKDCHYVRAIQVANSTRFAKAIFERFDAPKNDFGEKDQWQFALDPNSPRDIDSTTKALRIAIARGFVRATGLDVPPGTKLIDLFESTFIVEIDLNEAAGWNKPVIVSSVDKNKTTTNLRITVDYISNPFKLLNVEPVWPKESEKPSH